MNNKCLFCFKKIESGFYSLIIEPINLCDKCLSSFKIINKKFIYKKANGVILYQYNDFFKELLFQYKGKGDIVLSQCFLNYYKNLIVRKFRKYYLIPAPSNVEEDNERGFNHIEEIIKTIKLKKINCFYKSVKFKQTSKSVKERFNQKPDITIDIKKLEKVKSVLLIDDVATSFNTIKTMIDLIPQNIKIKVIILSSNYQGKKKIA